MLKKKETQNIQAMYTTDFSIDSISSIIPSETMDILAGLIQDMDLELVGVKVA